MAVAKRASQKETKTQGGRRWLTNNVGSLFGHVDEVTAGTRGEFNGVNIAGGSNDIRNMTDTCPACSAEI